MIRYGDLIAGYENGIVRFAREPYGDSVVCWIGDNWFYFTDDGYGYKPTEYVADYGYRFVLERVYDALNGTGKLAGLRDSDPDEYAYYEAVLRETGCMGHIA